MTQSDLGRLEQQVLTAESTWIGNVRGYEQALDAFKVQLGLPADTNLVLDDAELESLRIDHPELSVEDATQIALGARLDYLSNKDKLEDADRRLKVVANTLLPQVDLVAGGGIASDPNDHRAVPLPDPAHYNWNAGLDIDLGLDKKPERNAYRSALIERDRTARNVTQTEDQIRLDVRESWRQLDAAKRNYEISEIGVKLAERRVEEQDLLAELGRAKAQDQVDAQNALTGSKNELTRALVNHNLGRLRFWNNMGILYIKDNGQWEELHANAR
jgi:outer membrane protein TolC